MHKKLCSIVSFVLVFTFTVCVAAQAVAQECPLRSSSGPSTPSKAQTLEGQLAFHNDIRGWFELKLDRAVCGHDSIQLVPLKKEQPLGILMGCRVRSRGTIDFSPTGYYSAYVFQDVEQMEPVGKCVKQQPFPDYSSAKPDERVRAYTVYMHIDYRPGDHPLEFRVHSAGQELQPWQAYASYMLTGGYVLYGYCAKGFVVDKVYGTLAAHPMHFDEPRTPEDAAAFDPESAAAVGKTDLRLGYTCIRDPHRGH